MNNAVLVKKNDKCSIYWHIPKGWEQVTKGPVKPGHWLLFNTTGNNFKWYPSNETYQKNDVSEMTLVITRLKGGQSDGKPPK